MEDERPPEKEEGGAEKSKRELNERDEEIRELKAKLESLQGTELKVDLDEAQKFIEEENRRSEDYLKRLKYLQADFENYRKRVDREMLEAEDLSISGLMKRLLPVLDDLDLAVASAETNEESKGLLEGVGMVRKNLVSVLQSVGLRSIDAVGKPFNPVFHEAAERVDGTGLKEDTVVGEIRKGYIFKNKVIRPSMVKVESAVKTNGEIE